MQTSSPSSRRPIPQTLSSVWSSRLGIHGGSDIPAFGLSLGHTSHSSLSGARARRATSSSSSSLLEANEEGSFSSSDQSEAECDEAELAEPSRCAGLSHYARLGKGESGGRGHVASSAGGFRLILGRAGASCSALLGPLTGSVPIVVLNFATCATYGLLMVEGTSVEPQLLVAMQLYSAGATGIFLALKSGCSLTISSGDASVALYTNLWLRAAFNHPDCTDETREPTAIASVLLMTILMGTVYMLVGSYHAADLVQYLPFPIIAGFLGMVGASIVKGGLVVAVGHNLDRLADLVEAANDVPYEFSAALGLVIVLLVLRRVRVPANLLFMSTMAAALLLFYAPTTFLRIARSELRVRGFLFPISQPIGPLDIWRRLDLSRITWSALLPHSGEVFGTITILTISLVLRVSAIDSAAQANLDPDREVRITGLCNLAVGATGGLIGSHSPGLVSLNREVGSDGPLVGVMQAAMLVILWISAYPLTNVLPRFLLGGVLMSIGVVMLIEWVWVVPHVRMTPLSHLLVLAMTLFSSVYGMVPTIFGGILVAALLLVGRFSRLSVLKYHVSMSSHSSILRRSAAEAAYLRQQGERVHIVGLEGYLFEGTIVKLIKYLQQAVVALESAEPAPRREAERAKLKRSAKVGPLPGGGAKPSGGDGNDPEPAPDILSFVPHRPDFLVLDFTAVQGLNETAAALLQKFARVCTAHSIRLVYAAIGPNDAQLLHAHGQGAGSRFFQNTRDAVEFCEERLLERSGLFPRNEPMPSVRPTVPPSMPQSSLASVAASPRLCAALPPHPPSASSTPTLSAVHPAVPLSPMSPINPRSRKLDTPGEGSPAHLLSDAAGLSYQATRPANTSAAAAGDETTTGSGGDASPPGQPSRVTAFSVHWGQAQIMQGSSGTYVGSSSPTWSEVSIGWLESSPAAAPENMQSFRLPGGLGSRAGSSSSLLVLDSAGRPVGERFFPPTHQSSSTILEEINIDELVSKQAARSSPNGACASSQFPSHPTETAAPADGPSPAEAPADVPFSATRALVHASPGAPPPHDAGSSKSLPAAPPPYDAENPNAWLVHSELLPSVATCEDIFAMNERLPTNMDTANPTPKQSLRPPQSTWSSLSVEDSRGSMCSTSSAPAALEPAGSIAPAACALDEPCATGAADTMSLDTSSLATRGGMESSTLPQDGSVAKANSSASYEGTGHNTIDCEEGALAHLDEAHGAVEEARQEGLLPESFVPKREASGRAHFVSSRRRRPAGLLKVPEQELEPPRILVRHKSMPLGLPSTSQESRVPVSPAHLLHAQTHRNLFEAAGMRQTSSPSAEHGPTEEQGNRSSPSRVGTPTIPMPYGSSCQEISTDEGAPSEAIPSHGLETHIGDDGALARCAVPSAPVLPDRAHRSSEDSCGDSAVEPENFDSIGVPDASVLTPLLHSRHHAESDAALLARVGTWRAYEPNAMLCEQGELCDAMFFVAPGYGSVMVEVEVGHVGGPIQALHTGQHGALVGATSLLTRAPCGYSVLAIERTWVLALGHDCIKTLYASHPHTLIRLQRIALLQEPLNTRRLRIMSRLWLAGGWSGANFDQVTVRAAQGPRLRRAFARGGAQQHSACSAESSDSPTECTQCLASEVAVSHMLPDRAASQLAAEKASAKDSADASAAYLGSNLSQAGGSILVPSTTALVRARSGAKSYNSLLKVDTSSPAMMTTCASDSAILVQANSVPSNGTTAPFEPTIIRLREFSADIIGRQRSIADMAARWGAMFEELNAAPAIRSPASADDLDEVSCSPLAGALTPSSGSGHWLPPRDSSRERVERPRGLRADRSRPLY